MPTPPRHINTFLACIAALAAGLADAEVRADITPPSPTLNMSFGASVDFVEVGSTNYLAVGTTGLSVPGSVFIYRRSGLSNSWVFETQLNGTGIGTSEDFGTVLTMRAGSDGTILLAVGAPGDAISEGSAFIYRRSVAGAWTLEAKLTRTDGTFGDYLGGAIAIAPDLSQVAVAAAFDNATGCGGMQECAQSPSEGRGVVAVFKRTGGKWVFSGNATAPIAGTGLDVLGRGIAYGNSSTEPPQLLIGAPLTDVNGVFNAGAVHVVREQPAGTWTLQQTISGVSINGLPLGGFGHSIDVSGNRAIVGAPTTDLTSNGNVGRALTLKKNTTNGTWSVEANCILPDPVFTTSNSFFGRSVSILGEMLVIGTNLERAYLYRAIDGASTLFSTQPLQRPTTEAAGGASGFGGAVAIGNGLAATGMPLLDVDGVSAAGGVSIFDAFPGKFTSGDPSVDEGFGSAVAIGNQRAIIGAPGYDGTATNQGRIEIFERFSSGWLRIFTQTATDPSASAFAGRSVGATDDGLRFSFGAPGASSNAGAVYQGSTTDGVNFSFSKLGFAFSIASPQAGEALGASVAMKKVGATTWIVAGAPNFDATSADRGRVLVWRNGTLVQSIIGPLSQTGANFGSAVAIESYSDGAIDIVVGAPGEDFSGALDGGSIYVFRKSALATTFSQVGGALRHGAPQASGRYGTRLALKKAMLVVGCPSMDSPPLVDNGAAFAWTRSVGGTWSAVASGVGGANSGDAVGSSVSTNGTDVVVGVPGFAPSNPQLPVGRALLVRRVGSALNIVEAFSSSDSRQFDAYGTAVAIGTATNSPSVIGCQGDSNGDRPDAGSAYGFLGPANTCAADVDGDLEIGASDLSLLLSAWGTDGDGSLGLDINLDGIVDAGDLSLMLATWGACGQ